MKLSKNEKGLEKPKVFQKKISKSKKIFFGLVIVLAILSAINVFLPQGEFVGQFELPASKPVLAVVNFFIMLILYGGLGFLGLILTRKLGFAKIWDEKISNKQRFWNPLLIGVILGILFIIVDLILSRFSGIKMLHPPFPTSLVASAIAGIGDEVIFRLFFISFWVWLISHVIFRKKYQNRIFWIVAVISAIAFSFVHLPATMMIFGFNSISEIPVAFHVEVLLLNGSLSLIAAYYFRKYGLLAIVGIHFWLDVIWHVVYGVL